MSSQRLTGLWQIALGAWMAFLLVAAWQGQAGLAAFAAIGSAYCYTRRQAWGALWAQERRWRRGQ